MRTLYIKILIVALYLISACSRIKTYTVLDEPPLIFPDYSEVVIPPNIAPLNFYIHGNARRYMARIIAGSDSFDVFCRNSVKIPQKKWKRLLANNAGNNMTIKIFSKNEKGWKKYNDIALKIAIDKIDPFLAYRLIEPGYVYWDKMGIYQRNIESFEEKPILLNTLTGGSCMNCHSFSQNNPEKMLLHIRAVNAGTIFIDNKQITKVDTRTPDNISAAVYPRWHPQGRFVAFSTNLTSQAFHTTSNNLIEVYDSASDLIIYDTETNTIYSHPLISSSERFETHPEWSPDGKWLYFCSAPAIKMPENYDSLRYDIFRIDFDHETGKIGNNKKLVWQASTSGKTVAFPRISPDGKYMLVCVFDYGTFPVWHKESDLYIIDLETGDERNTAEINSNESESYHSWSTNGKWLAFTSRRIDGMYSRLYIAHFDETGKFKKPFLLPQKNPKKYEISLKSYNVPEFLTGKVEVKMRKLEKKVKK